MGDPNARHPRHNKAEVFAQLRDAHAREVTEDYVEMIADLIQEEGEARSVALAERFDGGDGQQYDQAPGA